MDTKEVLSKALALIVAGDAETAVDAVRRATDDIRLRLEAYIEYLHARLFDGEDPRAAIAGCDNTEDGCSYCGAAPAHLSVPGLRRRYAVCADCYAAASQDSAAILALAGDLSN
jgi:hypothetical protein